MGIVLSDGWSQAGVAGHPDVLGRTALVWSLVANRPGTNATIVSNQNPTEGFAAIANRPERGQLESTDGPATALPAQSLPGRDPAPPSADNVPVQVEDEGALASIFSATSVFIVVALGLFGLLVSRKLRSRQALALMKKNEVVADADAEWVEEQTVEGRIRPQGGSLPGQQLVRTSGGVPARGSMSTRMTVAGPTSLLVLFDRSGSWGACSRSATSHGCARITRDR